MPNITFREQTLAAAARAYQSGPSTGPVTVAVGCAGGRHRAAVVATTVAGRVGADLVHRDLHLPVIAR